MKKNHYYCIIQQTKDTTEVIYISTSENACDSVFNRLLDENNDCAYHKSIVDMLGTIQNN